LPFCYCRSMTLRQDRGDNRAYCHAEPVEAYTSFLTLRSVWNNLYYLLDYISRCHFECNAMEPGNPSCRRWDTHQAGGINFVLHKLRVTIALIVMLSLSMHILFSLR